MDRRGFLKSILAAGVAPAFIGSSVLMPVRKLWTPEESRIIGVDHAGPDDSYVVITEVWRGNDCVIKYSPPVRLRPGEKVVVPGDSTGIVTMYAYNAKRPFFTVRSA